MIKRRFQLVGGIILGSFPLWMYGGLAGVFALGAFLMAFRRFVLISDLQSPYESEVSSVAP